MKIILDEHYLQQGQNLKRFFKATICEKWILKRPFFARGIL